MFDTTPQNDPSAARATSAMPTGLGPAKSAGASARGRAGANHCSADKYACRRRPSTRTAIMIWEHAKPFAPPRTFQIGARASEAVVGQKGQQHCHDKAHSTRHPSQEGEGARQGNQACDDERDKNKETAALTWTRPIKACDAETNPQAAQQPQPHELGLQPSPMPSAELASRAAAVHQLLPRAPSTQPTPASQSPPSLPPGNERLLRSSSGRRSALSAPAPSSAYACMWW